MPSSATGRGRLWITLACCLVILIQLGVDPVAIVDNLPSVKPYSLDRFIDNRIKIGMVAVILRLAFIGIDQLAMDIQQQTDQLFSGQYDQLPPYFEDSIAAIGRILYRIERVIDFRPL